MPAVIVKFAEVAPDATVTLAGTLAAAGLFELSETTAPPEGAAAVSVTVPIPDCPLTIVVGLTVRPLKAAAAAPAGLIVTPNVSLAPEYEAVNVTDVGAVTVPALSVNVPEVDPCGMVRVDGMPAPAGDEVSVTVSPPLGAAEDNWTVHVAVDGGVIDTELQENPFKPSAVIVTVPTVADIGNLEPPASDASVVVVSWSDEEVSVVELDTVSDTVATTPLAIVVALGPDRTQITDPGCGLHDRDLFAAVAAGPAENVAAEKSAVEYLRVHSSEAGGSLAGFVRFRFKVRLAPALAEPELTPSDTCALAAEAVIRMNNK